MYILNQMFALLHY